MQPQPLPAWLEHFLLWLNQPVWHHWCFAAASFALVTLLAFAARAQPGDRRRWWQHPALFSAALILALAAFRWPTWFIQDELNPDESQILAGAVTLRHFPVYWRDVDTMTAGPLDVYVPAGAAALGLPLNFFGGRMLAALLQAAALLFTGALFQRLAPERMARVGLLPPLLFWCLVSHHDFIHYSSELVAVTLLAAAGWLVGGSLAGTTPPGRAGAWGLFLGGFVLGIVPLAKLQGGPPALALGIIGVAGLAWRRPAWGWKPLCCLLAGGITAPLLAAAVIAAAGQGGAAWEAYVKQNLGYVQAAPDSAGWIVRLTGLVNQVALFRAYWWTALAGAVGLGLAAYKRAGIPERAQAAAGAILLGASLVAVLAPGRPLTHYLEFLVLPLSVLVFVLWRALRDTVPLPATLVFAAIALAPLLWTAGRNPNIYAGQFTRYRYDHAPSQAAYFIRQHSQAGDTLAMWGWRAQLHVETGLPQGTREAQTTRQLSTDPAVQAYYLERYLHDLRERSPTWFVDAVGPASFGYHDRAAHGHESLPPLAQIIATEYDYVGEIENLRIYRRR